MDEYIQVSSKTVEDALMEASIQLGTSKDNIEYVVLERETKGFLGIGARKAVIKARAKKTEEEMIDEVLSSREEKKKNPKPSSKKSEEKREKKDKKKEVKETKEVKEERREVKTEKKAEKKQEKKQEKKAEKPEKKPAVSDKKEEKKDEKKEEIRPEKPAKAAPAQAAPAPEKKTAEKAERVPADPKETIARAEEFLKNVCAAMDIEAQIKSEFSDDTLSVELAGEDMGLLIGKRGQTLDSLQYLTSLVVNKGKASYVRVKVDTEDYRERRKATLENLAKNIAFKVKKTRRSVYLEPMNPYERRIIHSALQNDPYVTTHSEGEEPCRKVVVTLKKREHSFSQQEESFSEE